MAIGPGGTIVVAGYASNGSNNDLAIARYNPNGSLDSTFGGGDGRVTQAIGAHDDEIYGVVVLPNGKIIVAGRTRDSLSDDYDMVVARFNSNGTLDTTFNGTGFNRTDYRNLNVANEAYAITVQGSNILIAGRTQHKPSTGLTYDFILARYHGTGTNDGKRDTLFGSSGAEGYVVTQFGGDNQDDQAYSVVVPSSDTILVGGFTSPTATETNFAIAKYNANGVPVTGFGTNGKATTTFGTNTLDEAYDMAVTSSGFIVLAGRTKLASAGLSGPWNVALARFNPTTGIVDSSFGSSGRQTSNLTTGSDEAFSVAIQSDNKIVIGGIANNDFLVARYTTSGTLDPTFSTDGWTTTPFFTTDKAHDVAIQSDGKILAAGYTVISSTDHDFAVARYIGVNAPEIVVEFNGTSLTDNQLPAIDFGTTTVNVPVTRTFTIRNTGTLALNLTGVSGTTAGFTATAPASPVAPGTSKTFTITMTAKAAGPQTATLKVGNNDSDENPFEINVKGVVAQPAPEIVVELNGANLTDNQLPAIDFGTTPVGVPVTKTFTIRNTGTLPLNITGVTVSNTTFSATTPTSPVAVGSSKTFTITMKATSVGTPTAIVRVGNNDSDENPFEINVKGTVAQPAPEIVVELNGANLTDNQLPAIEFGTTKVGVPVTKTFTIRNTGTLPLNITGVTVSNTSFSATTPTSPVAAGSSKTFTITLKGTSVGAPTAIVRIGNNDSNENPFDINVKGSVTLKKSSGGDAAVDVFSRNALNSTATSGERAVASELAVIANVGSSVRIVDAGPKLAATGLRAAAIRENLSTVSREEGLVAWLNSLDTVGKHDDVDVALPAKSHEGNSADATDLCDEVFASIGQKV